MNRIALSLPAFLLLLLSFQASARKHQTDSLNVIDAPVQRFYVANGLDGGIFSTAMINKPNGDHMGKLRFSYIVNAGTTFNFNFGRHFGLFTGIDVKNIGYIESINGYTVKRRNYNAGIPLGLRVGNMRHRKPSVFLGGGADFPVEYKEKVFVIRSQKTKINEWFSDRTPAVMPYVFLGASVYRGITVKVQYYPNNFMNPDFADKTGAKPYAGNEVHIAMVSIGYTTLISRRTGFKFRQGTQLKTM